MQRSSSASELRSPEQGMAAVEFALLLPFLIILIVAALVMGHAMFVRTRLLSHAYARARACAVELERSERAVECADGAREHFSATFEETCDVGPELEISTDEAVEGLQYVRVVQLTVRCKYTNGWFEMLEDRLEEALTFGNFEVVALVPYSVRSPEEQLLDSGI